MLVGFLLIKMGEIQREIRYGILIVLHFRCEGYRLSTSMEHFVRRLVHRNIPILFVFMTNFSFLKLIFLFLSRSYFLVSCKSYTTFSHLFGTNLPFSPMDYCHISAISINLTDGNPKAIITYKTELNVSGN